MNKDDDEKSYNRSMFFVEKKELLQTVSDVFDTLLEMTYEIEILREKLKKIRHSQEDLKRKISHLRHMIKKDMLITPNLHPDHPKILNLKALQMSAIEWNNYITRSESNTEHNSPEQSGRNNTIPRSSSPDEVSEDIHTGSSVESPRALKSPSKNSNNGDLI